MVTIIKSNKNHLWSNFIIGLIFCLGIIGISVILISDIKATNDIVEVIYIIFMLTCFVFAYFAVLVDLIRIPIGCVVDPLNKELTIKYSSYTKREISVDNIDFFTNTIVRSGRYSQYPNSGIFLYQKNGERIVLSNYSLKDYSPILYFLKENNISCKGDEKFKWLKYYFNKKS